MAVAYGGTTAAQGANNVSSGSATWTHNPGASVAVIVFLLSNDGTPATSVTYAGAQMTLIDQADNGAGEFAFVYGITRRPSGLATISVTKAGSFTARSVHYNYGESFGLPEHGYGTGPTSATPVPRDGMVVCLLGGETVATTTATRRTTNWGSPANRIINVSDVATTTAVSWTAGTNFWFNIPLLGLSNPLDLSDDFNSGVLNADWWRALDMSTTGVLDVSGGRIAIGPAAPATVTRTAMLGSPGLSNLRFYDMTNSSVTVQLVQRPDPGVNRTAQGWFDICVDTAGTNNRAGFSVQDWYLRCTENVGGVNNTTAGEIRYPYEPRLHRWLRLRENAGTLYWDASADGVNWNVLRASVPTIDITRVRIRLGYVVSANELLVNGADPLTNRVVFDNVNLAMSSIDPRLGFSTGNFALGGVDGGTADTRRYFENAEWLWGRIPNNPVLHPDSAAMVATAFSVPSRCNMVGFACTLVHQRNIVVDTPRYAITPTNNWGPNPFLGDMIPIPDTVPIPTGSEKQISIADPVIGTVYNLYKVVNNSGVWGCAWGGKTDLHDDGIETTGFSTGSAISRYGGVITRAEIANGVIPHALLFSSSCVDGTFVYPAAKTDGTNPAGSPAPLPMGTRVQLDPSIDLAAIPNITRGELIIGRALQRYGAYVSDSNTGAAVVSNFMFEYEPNPFGATMPHQDYINAGLTTDTFTLSRIPWSSIRVLNNWDGT